MVKGIATAGLFSAIASSLSVPHVYADGPLNFPPFTSSPAPSPAPGVSSPENLPEIEEKAAPPRVRNDHPRTTSAGFDPEALERGAKALKEINSSNSAKQVFINPLIYVHFYYLYLKLSYLPFVGVIVIFFFFCSDYRKQYDYLCVFSSKGSTFNWFW